MAKEGFLSFVILIYFIVFPLSANADLFTIGTATLQGDRWGGYKLIYDNDQHLVWLDYSKEEFTSLSNVHGGIPQFYRDWASGLNDPGSISYQITPGINVSWEGDWRLPAMVDGVYGTGYEGDPDGDGIYSYSAGYNLANSEMGHLYFYELGNGSYVDTNGNWNHMFSLRNTGPFDRLMPFSYISSTDYGAGPIWDMVNVWGFNCYFGWQGLYGLNNKDDDAYAMAVIPAEVSVAPVPEPATILLIACGIVVLAGFRKRFFNGAKDKRNVVCWLTSVS